MRILIAEDDSDIASFVQQGLIAAGFSIDWAPDGEIARRLALTHDYDGIILDLNLPKKDGLEVCRAIRAAGIVAPILMLTVVTDTSTKIRAIEQGADDYLTKPFSFQELLVRIRALLRRQKQIIPATLKVADLEFDTASHTVTRGGRPIRLSKKELELLEYFMRHPGTTLSRAMILEHVWDMNADPFTNTVDVHVRTLRQKLNADQQASLIHTVRGFGYQMRDVAAHRVSPRAPHKMSRRAKSKPAQKGGSARQARK